MKWSIAGLFCVLVACSEAKVLFREGNDLPLLEGSVCPPPELISPCTCFINTDREYANRVTAQCSNFTNSQDLAEIFTKNPNWNIQDVHIDGAVMPYIPAVMFEEAVFQSLNVSSSTLQTLFDETPNTTQELSLYMHNVKFLRGFQWSSIARANLKELWACNTDIWNFGLEFKKNIPIKVQALRFENTNTKKITDKAFENLKDLIIMTLKGGSIKVISRDMFPRPWNVTFLDLSFHKITILSEDMFADMPGLKIFLFEGNLLRTLPGKAFTENVLLNVRFFFVGNPLNCNCDMKWITVPGKIRHYFAGKCAEPESFKGKLLASFNETDFSFCA
ncbi:hypothetical protein JTE90_000782 [Oedothorax gibbosus]|uniref:Uncharacterized protein n=1 Tax=Oedothorax gibbosus TaxID=931172 RepID=A0AAV6UC94_9ARAC|nr:hypothetical protein JTE90_000782 [Oedothorax gibbosus]